MTELNRPYAILSAVIVALAVFASPAKADSGFYIGGSIGGATIEAEFDPNSPPVPGFPSEFDEDDTAYKLFGGYKFDLPVIDLGVEAGYVDFGAPELDVLGDPLELDTTGLNLWGTAGLELGPIDVFAKLGYISWDVEANFLGDSISDDGSDMGYGLGVGFQLGPIGVRGEYEVYDVEDADISMLSVGVVFQF